ncbi:hypothetical protein AA12717_3541 [Gluconacetobacter sacchari DSM 12717]|uniref:Uncharacterized protein n=2 Tax=Gluconacetobacter sacchari TaxID=92759 RepID=A0A7W4IEK2_9PROT|nr:hypothetical protein [Gluconacetobacter sacchari]MBB2161312.1 hypothetical protein [Gluconacetobacter sacchari]GBQ30623.1 hypothetical protein AA12717_3541 [Gluconacetobacter sacchari DSM 12717]
MKWTLTSGMLYGTPGGKNPLEKPERRPAIASDDGVIIMWTATVPIANIITLVYRKDELEVCIYAIREFDPENEKNIFVSAPLRPGLATYMKIIGNIEDGKKEYYTPTKEEIDSIGIHLHEALPLWRKDPPESGFITTKYEITEVSC